MPLLRIRDILTLRCDGVSLSAMVKQKPSNDALAAKLKGISRKIYQLLVDNPEGLDIVEIRKLLNCGETQQHLDKRTRELRKYFHVPYKKIGERRVYKLEGTKENIGDEGHITPKLRAQLLHIAKGRCQMCGRTVQEDGIKFQIDHKVPQEWGGLTTPDNLWAICETCNQGKRNYFASFDEETLKKIVAYPSVHERIAYLLKMHMGKAVSSQLLEFVANATERQEDWHKRLRELRYPVIGLKIKSGRHKNAKGYTESTYTLLNWKEIPSNHKKLIRDWDNRKKRKGLSSSEDLD
jgi:hypothetical protein